MSGNKLTPVQLPDSQLAARVTGPVSTHQNEPEARLCVCARACVRACLGAGVQVCGCAGVRVRARGCACFLTGHPAQFSFAASLDP